MKGSRRGFLVPCRSWTLPGQGKGFLAVFRHSVRRLCLGKGVNLKGRSAFNETISSKSAKAGLSRLGPQREGVPCFAVLMEGKNSSGP